MILNIKKIKYKLIVFSIIIFSFLLIGNNVFASITNGTIDSTYHYAWGENVGFVDFSNVTISDTSLSGSIYGENMGWVNLSTVTNTKEGQLGGYAWGENVGWIDFSKVTIGTNGAFSGGAYGENIGWIIFGSTTNMVLTDWRPESVRPRRNSGFFRPATISVVNTTPTVQTNTPQANPNQVVIVRTLRLNTKGDDVRQLQIFLNTHGYTISNTGAGSSGKETNIFGLKTKQALIKFQKANNLPADGVLGPLTKILLK